MTNLRQRMLEDMRLRNLAARTQEGYISYVAAFAKTFKKSPDLLGAEHARQYLLSMLDRGLSTSTVNIAQCALRFFYRVTLDRPWPEVLVPLAKRERTLPVVLAPSEVLRLFEAARKPKCRMMLMTVYAAGLRSAEVAALRVADIDSQRMVIHVVKGKGSKDRVVMLSQGLLEELREYWRRERPSGLLFPGRAPDSPMARDALRKACLRAADDAGLTKHVTPRTLRHCFATHLLEDGANIRIIQQLLGHRSLNTTARYTHVSRATVCSVTSPLDRIRPVAKADATE